jgi:hypothetical protein
MRTDKQRRATDLRADNVHDFADEWEAMRGIWRTSAERNSRRQCWTLPQVSPKTLGTRSDKPS